ncbi:Ankyrin repeat-containing domain protein [Lactarius tabidus]
MDDAKWDQVRESLEKWVPSPDPSTNQSIACGIQHDGSAQWFFRGAIFSEWKSTGSLLWIYGKPGSGKSILCSAIIQDIQTLCKAGLGCIAYFYFDFRDLEKQNRRNLLPSLLIQLSVQSSLRCDILHRLYLEHGKGTQKPTEAVLIQCLKDMLTVPDQPPIYIILDALDECPNSYGIPSSRAQILTLVKQLMDLRLPRLHICITSRPEFDIRAALGRLALHSVSLHDESGQKEDIVDYVKSVVYSDSDETMMKRWREEDKKMVVETLSEKADGMFRWVFCQLETLQQCLPQSVLQTLNELPDSLDETYERVMMEIKRANQSHAYRMLQCLTVANRPLFVAELAELLAFDFKEAKGGIPKLNSNWRWEDHEEAVLSTCSSLVTVVPNGGSPIVQFSHFSVKEFLMSDRLATSRRDISQFHISLLDAHTLLAQASLAVLLRDPDVNGHVDSGVLAAYAAEHWTTHARFDNVASHVRDGMQDLFDPDKPYFEAWVQLYDIHAEDLDDFPNMPDSEPGARPLYYAALCGFLALVEHLTLKYPHYASARGGLCGTALHAASFQGRLQVVRYLLQHGVDVNARDSGEDTSLLLASWKGHRDIVQCLLDHGADLELRDQFLHTPLHLAALYHQVDSVRVLLEHNADVNPQDSEGQTPLHKSLETPLHLASLNPDLLDVIRDLLEHGANLDAEDRAGETPLQLSLERRYDEVTRLLSGYSSTKPMSG